MKSIKEAVETFMKDRIAPSELYSKARIDRMTLLREIGKVEVTVSGDVISIYGIEDFVYDIYPPYVPFTIHESLSGKTYRLQYNNDYVSTDGKEENRLEILDVKCLTMNELSHEDMLKRYERLSMYAQYIFRDALEYLRRYNLIPEVTTSTPIHDKKAHLLTDLQMEHYLHGNIDQDAELARVAWKEADLNGVAFYLIQLIFDAAKLCNLMNLPIRELWTDQMNRAMTFKHIGEHESHYESDEKTVNSRIKEIIEEHNQRIEKAENQKD